MDAVPICFALITSCRPALMLTVATAVLLLKGRNVNGGIRMISGIETKFETRAGSDCNLVAASREMATTELGAVDRNA